MYIALVLAFSLRCTPVKALQFDFDLLEQFMTREAYEQLLELTQRVNTFAERLGESESSDQAAVCLEQIAIALAILHHHRHIIQ